MNAISNIGVADSRDINLTALMRRERIAKIENHLLRWSVTLLDGRIGIGGTVGEALDKAKQPDAQNVLRAA